jgi:hypothetical protein
MAPRVKGSRRNDATAPAMRVLWGDLPKRQPMRCNKKPEGSLAPQENECGGTATAKQHLRNSSCRPRRRRDSAIQQNDIQSVGMWMGNERTVLF